jgi:hypothetical protein
MPYKAMVYHVMIASPSDVAESDVIREVILEWNVIHSHDKGIVLLPIAWTTHAAPSTSGPAQSVVNEQVLANADLLIAAFSARLGSPTATAPSGTAEEIRRHRDAGKPAMIYFSKADVPRADIDPQQLAALEAFESEIKKDALVDDYSSSSALRTKLTRQLALTVLGKFKGPEPDGTGDNPSRDATLQAIGNVTRLLQEKAASGNGPRSDAILSAVENVTRLIQAQEATSTLGRQSGITEGLSPEAKRLLKAVAMAPRSGVTRFHFRGGLEVQAGGINFVTRGDARSEARWEAALEELEQT